MPMSGRVEDALKDKKRKPLGYCASTCSSSRFQRLVFPSGGKLRQQSAAAFWSFLLSVLPRPAPGMNKGAVPSASESKQGPSIRDEF